MTKLIIAGSRGVDKATFFKAMEYYIKTAGVVPTEVVSGTARGVDTYGEEWARREGIPVKRFPADWDTYGKSAGYIRNAEMAEYADACFVVWDGVSKGSKHMMQRATSSNLILHVEDVGGSHSG